MPPAALPRRSATLVACLRLVLGSFVAAGPGWAADAVRVHAAGSLAAPMKELIAASGLPTQSVAEPVFGPAGLLRGRLERGEGADLYLSADLAQPRRLVEAGKAHGVVPFARNSLCVVAPRSLGLTPETVLPRLLSPTLRLLTSTPVADPGGDYAQAVFARAEAVQPGARAVLATKAMHLLGAPGAMVPVAGCSPAAAIFLSDRADALLYYCGGRAALLKEASDLAFVPLPTDLTVPATYSMTLLTDNPDAMTLALFVLSEKGQGILARHDLIPIAASGP